MFRLTAILSRFAVLVACVAVLAGVLAGPSFADDTTTICYPDGQCIVVVVTPPDPGDPGGTSGGGDQGKCTWGDREVPCQSDLGSWVTDLQCYVRLMQPQPAIGTTAWEGHTDGAVYTCALPGCPDPVCFRTVWLAQPPAGVGPTPAQLAQQALASLQMPKPSTGRYPSGRLNDGRPYTVVRAHTWYWTDPDGYKPLSARAAAGAVWAEVTVTPVALSFTAGDGSAAVSCAGPGSVWKPGDGAWAASPSGCDFAYRHTSIHQPGQVVTATYGIRWQVSWVGSGGSSGSLPDQTTTSNSTFAVAEVQSVVTR